MTAKGYRQDLAYIHDVGFGDFAKNAAPGLLVMLRQSITQRERGHVRVSGHKRDCVAPR